MARIRRIVSRAATSRGVGLRGVGLRNVGLRDVGLRGARAAAVGVAALGTAALGIAAVGVVGVLAGPATSAFAVPSALPGSPVVTPAITPAISPTITLVPSIPLLSMAVSDGALAPRPGAPMSYAITVINSDRLPLPLTVRLVVPPSLDDLVAGDGGTISGRTVTWHLPMEPGAQTVVRFTSTLRPDVTGRLALTACSYLDGSDRPTACASDLDQITPVAGGHKRAALTAGAAFVVLAAYVVFLIRRLVRRRTARQPTNTQRADPQRTEPQRTDPQLRQRPPASASRASTSRDGAPRE